MRDALEYIGNVLLLAAFLGIVMGVTVVGGELVEAIKLGYAP